MKAKIDTAERLDFLYGRNDEIEREVAKINRHGRREQFTEEETTRKDKLLVELNNVINEIERLEARTATG